MKDDEKYFLKRIFNEGARDANNNIRSNYKTPRDIINGTDFPIHYKRAWYILEKWSGKDWYNYGVTLDLGWLEEKGIEAAKSL